MGSESMRQCRESAASRRRLLAAVLGAAVSCAVAGGCGGSAAAGDAAASTDYAEFAGAVPVTITGYTGDAMEPFISKDGRYLFFNNRNDPAVDTNIYYASRIDDATFSFLGAVPGVNSPSLDAVPSLDLLGNFYFVSTRSYTTTLATIYSGAFSATGVTDVALVTGVSRDTPGAGLNYAPSISVDGLELFFTRVAALSGGAQPAIYRATRADPAAPFSAVQRVSAATGFVEAPSLSADGRVIYFHKLEGGRYVIYCARR